MKRALIVLGLVALVAVFTLSAETSSFYPLRFDVVKVYSHAEGYRVIYRKGSTGMAEFYIPAKWFVPGGKAELIRANDPSFPYVVLYYKEGKFSHVRLYVKASMKDETWGVLEPDVGRGKFNVDELKPEF